MKKAILFSAVFVFMLYFVSCAEEQAVPPDEIALTEDEAIAIALRDNLQVLLKAEEVLSAKSKIREARAGLFPALDFTASRTETQGLYPKDIPQTTTQTTLKQYLYRGGKTVNTIKQAGHEFEVAQALLDKAKLETILEVKRAFYTVFLAQEFATLNRAILDNTERYLAYIKVRYKNGRVSESEVLNTEYSLSSVRQAYEASLNQIESGLTLLKILLNVDDKVKLHLEGGFSYQARELAFDQAFLKAMQSRPEIKQYEAQEKADEKAIEIAKAESRPSIYASWDYYSRSTTSLTFSPSKGWQDYNVAGITVSWPVFDGWLTKAKVEQAISDLKQSRLNKEQAIKDIGLELKNAYLSLKDAIAGISTKESEAEFYQDNLSSVTQKYNNGIASILDLNDATIKYEVSMFNKKQAVYDYIIAKSDFDKATGGF